jgi:hypothetical protein
MLFDRVAHDCVAVAIGCLVVLVALELVASVRSLGQRNGAVRIFPLACLLSAAILFAVREIAYRSGWIHGPSGWWAMEQVFFQQRFGEWAQVVFPIFCAVGSVALFAIGGIALLVGCRPSRWRSQVQGTLILGAGACLAIALVSIVGWAASLDAAAPGFLTSHFFLAGTLLPFFAAALVIMTAAFALIALSSVRFVRAIPQVPA